MNKLNHVAFIMDGNGRWGKKRGRGRNFGHFKGVETVKKTGSTRGGGSGGERPWLPAIPAPGALGGRQNRGAAARTGAPPPCAPVC